MPPPFLGRDKEAKRSASENWQNIVAYVLEGVRVRLITEAKSVVGIVLRTTKSILFVHELIVVICHCVPEERSQHLTNSSCVVDMHVLLTH